MVCLCQLLKRMDKNWSCNAKLLQPFFDSLRQHTLTLSRQMHEYVRSGAGALDQIIRLGAIDKLDGAVVMTSKLLRQRANTGFDPSGKTPDRKQQLILPRFDPGRFGRLVAEVDITLNVMPEFGQRAVIGIPGRALDDVMFVHHGTISCHEIV